MKIILILGTLLPSMIMAESINYCMAKPIKTHREAKQACEKYGGTFSHSVPDCNFGTCSRMNINPEGTCKDDNDCRKGEECILTIPNIAEEYKKMNDKRTTPIDPCTRYSCHCTEIRK